MKDVPEPSTEEEPLPDRWTMIRDIALTQLKLVIDGLRDILLVPAALIVGIVSVLSTDREQRSWFYRLICMGKQTEGWINLFGAYDNAPEKVKREYDIDDRGIDALVGKVEAFVVDEYRKGGLTAQAKEKIDRALDQLQRDINRDPDRSA